MPDMNVTPLLLAITQPLYDEANPLLGPSLLSRVAAAAMSGWVEGHLAHPGHRLDENRLGDMPHPPFPSDTDPDFNRIVRDASGRFSDGEEVAAVAYAAALAWQAGRRAGGLCPGCAPYGHDNPVCQAVRTGRAEVELKLTVELRPGAADRRRTTSLQSGHEHEPV